MNRITMANTARPRIRPPPPFLNEKNDRIESGSVVAETMPSPIPSTSSSSTSTLRNVRRRQTANPMISAAARSPPARMVESSMKPAQNTEGCGPF
jgi:hypothetical protein